MHFRALEGLSEPPRGANFLGRMVAEQLATVRATVLVSFNEVLRDFRREMMRQAFAGCRTQPAPKPPSYEDRVREAVRNANR
jgi:hypothetical protein